MRKNCDSCIYDDFGDVCKFCVTAFGFPPSHWEPKEIWEPDTNADRIRSMTDEELAKVPMKWSGYSCVFPNRECPEGNTCEKCLLEWLKQPVEE